MAKRPAPGTVRFMRDGSLVTEQGWHLHPGDELAPMDARALTATHRVLLHSFLSPTEDITGDPTRLEEVLKSTVHGYELFAHTARMYSDGTHRVLVFEWHH